VENLPAGILAVSEAGIESRKPKRTIGLADTGEIGRLVAVSAKIMDRCVIANSGPHRSSRLRRKSKFDFCRVPPPWNR
jgi:hypothetical protein